MTESYGFGYLPLEHEAEKASNSYIMSLIAITAGLPLPVINLAATLIFYLGNKKGTYFVRWHCLQAFLSQSSLLVINTVAVVWSLKIFFGSGNADNSYIAYLFTIMIFNLLEFIATIDAAVKTRKGIHVNWWFYGPLTNIICREQI